MQLDQQGKFLEGPLYHSSRSMECKYLPEELLNTKRYWHEKALEDSLLTHDCMGHSVNYALRHPFFTYREQLQRLATLRCKK